MAITEKIVESTVQQLFYNAAVSLPEAVRSTLRCAKENEEKPVAISQLETILSNINLAEENKVPLCQDTGVPLIFADIGTEAHMVGDPRAAMTRGVAKASDAVPLRQNVINPFTKENSGNNTGWNIPAVEWDVIPNADYIELTAIPKGFGSEMRGSICWVLTSEDIARATVRSVLDVVKSTMGETCPPIIIGVGVGGFADTSMTMAKHALFRPLGSRNKDPLVAALEDEILADVNGLGLGPMGLGGKTYALDIHIEYSGAHTAIAPISIVFQCWAARYSKARIYNDGRVEYITHKEAENQ